MEITPKDVLYRQINEITEPRILKELTTGDKKAIVSEILRRCIPEIASLSGDSSENFGIFAEGLSHYLLTNALIPSQRKITIKNVEVDVVIPDSRTLGTSSENSLVLYFAKTSNKESILGFLAGLSDVQPHSKNILVISKDRLDVPHKTYDPSSESSFSEMLVDVEEFLRSKPQSKFKIFKT